MRKFIRSLVTGTSVLALGLAATVSGSAAPDGTAGQRGAPAVDGLTAEVLAAMQRDLGLTADQARQRIAQQAKAIELDAQLRDRLGAAFGGSWFDAATGKLVVAVADARRVSDVTAAGAQARVVKHSQAKLEAIKAELDGLAGKPAGTTRAAGGPRDTAVNGLASWRVDTLTNSVVVTAVRGGPRAAALDRLARHGDAVRVEYTDVAPRTTDPYMDGGDAIGVPAGGCSAGFNLRNPSTGQGFLLTAGHCGVGGGGVTGHDGNYFGPFVSVWFPNFDDGLVRNDNPGYWIQGPWVDSNPSHGTSVYVISGYSDAPVGTSICKSGRTTRLTCGTITGKDETVNYAQGPVYGMTRHNACVEPGDSGGSNFTGSSAEGVTSGAQLYGGRCGQVYGYPNVSWYFPIVDSLAYYGPAFGVTLW